MAPKKNPFDQLCEYSKEITIWHTLSNLLEWDQDTYMPEGAIDFRSLQSSLLTSHTHKLRVGPKFKKLLSAFINIENGTLLDPTLNFAQKAALNAWRRDYIKATKLPSSFVKNFAAIATKASSAWSQSKKESNFKTFAPHLEKIVKFNQKKAAYLGFQESPYDALLDLYEPDATVATLTPLFDSLKNGLKELLLKIKSKPLVDTSFLKDDFDPIKQIEFGKMLLNAMGFKPETSRLDLTSHPFCTTMHPTDIRMTTRIHPDDVMSNIFSILHEGGHGLYGKNLPVESFGTPLGEQVSLGIDESQSRFWETRIGRSHPFWERFLPDLKKAFPQISDISLDSFYTAINTVKPSFIRVEADEVTYTMHIILRFELEKMLLEGSLKVKEIPEAWNQKMEELIGIRPSTDAMGCLQDIHWSLGFMGYFPTYALGNIYAAQFFEKFAQTHPDWEHKVAQGNLAFIQEWLKTHIHQWGRQYCPHELIEKVTGKPLSEKPFLNYLTSKYQKIYQF